MKYNTIIFDVDGTLIDTRLGIMSSVKHVLNKFNLKQLSDKKLYDFVGISPLQEAFCHFCSINDELSQKCAEEFRTYYNENELFNASVYNGITELLEYLKTNNYKLGIATYKREDLVLKLLNHFKLINYFDCILGADNKNKLTKTNMINNCILTLDTKKESSIMIGDSCHDAEAAKQIGIPFIGVTYGFGFKNKEEADIYNPVFIADKPHKILKYIKSIKENRNGRTKLL